MSGRRSSLLLGAVAAIVLGACSSAGSDGSDLAGPAVTIQVADSSSTSASTTPPAALPSTALPSTTQPAPLALTDDGVSVVATGRVGEVVARVAPDAESEVVARFENPGTNGLPPVFQVIGSIDGPWLEVLLPIRPNGSRGWLAASDVDLASNPYRIEVITEEHRMIVYRNHEVVVDTEVAIGTGATPTPLGSFYLTELLRPPDPTGPYGTHAFGLSGFSETLRSFNGGEGVVGIHGTNDPAALGTDVSHGCIRVANETIDDMASFLPLGTPVAITRQSLGS